MIAKFRGGKKRESELHRRFARSRIHGEWFRRTPEVEEWLFDIDASVHPLAVTELDENAREIPLLGRLAVVAVVFGLIYLLLAT